MTTTLQTLITIISSALHRPDDRKQLIDKFQQMIRDAPDDISESWEWDILRELAYDLDFYEADPNVRSEDASYYGDVRLEEVIRGALRKFGLSGRGLLPGDSLNDEDAVT